MPFFHIDFKNDIFIHFFCDLNFTLLYISLWKFSFFSSFRFDFHYEFETWTSCLVERKLSSDEIVYRIWTKPPATTLASIDERCELLLLIFFATSYSVEKCNVCEREYKIIHIEKIALREDEIARSQNISPHRHDRESVCNPFSSVNRERISWCRRRRESHFHYKFADCLVFAHSAFPRSVDMNFNFKFII